MGHLMDLLERYEVGNSKWQDKLIWSPDEENGFSVSSLHLGGGRKSGCMCLE